MSCWHHTQSTCIQIVINSLFHTCMVSIVNIKKRGHIKVLLIGSIFLLVVLLFYLHYGSHHYHMRIDLEKLVFQNHCPIKYIWEFYFPQEHIGRFDFPSFQTVQHLVKGHLLILATVDCNLLFSFFSIFIILCVNIFYIGRCYFRCVWYLSVICVLCHFADICHVL